MSCPDRTPWSWPNSQVMACGWWRPSWNRPDHQSPHLGAGDRAGIVCARRSVAGEVDGAAMSVAWTYQSPACATCSTSEDALTVAAAGQRGCSDVAGVGVRGGADAGDSSADDCDDGVGVGPGARGLRPRSGDPVSDGGFAVRVGSARVGADTIHPAGVSAAPTRTAET